MSFPPHSKMQNRFWSFKRQVNYHETDAMGVVHHTHYLRFYEEARVAWIHDIGLAEFHFPHCDVHWAVLETRGRHLLPAYFGQTLHVHLQVARQGLKLGFQYATYAERQEKVIALGETWLAPVNSKKRPVKLPTAVKDVFERDKWTETWL